MNSKVVIDAFNPYEAIFPNRIVITKEELHLIKTLRSRGIDYHINSEHKSQLYILSKKNFVQIRGHCSVNHLVADADYIK